MKHLILQKSNFHKQGGIEKNSWRIACAFADKGYNVSILTSGNEKQFPQHANIDFYSCKTRGPGFCRIKQYDQFCRSWNQENPSTIIFGMDRNRFQTHLRAGNGVHASYLQTRLHSHGKMKTKICAINPLHQMILEIEKTSFEYPGLKRLIANSHMVRNEIIRFYNINPSKVCVIHNGVEWIEKENDFLEWEKKKELFAKKFHLDPHCYHFLFVGHGYFRKGLKPLLLALSLLENKNFHLSIVGKEKKMRDFMLYAHKLHLGNKISFFGPQKKMTPFYQLADCLVIPSFYDPFANVTVEALSMGLFIISSKSNGGHEILTNQNGVIIEDLSDTDSIKQTLEIALGKPKTPTSASLIRSSVKYLDFSKQLETLIDLILVSE